MIGLHPPIHEPPERVSLNCPLGLRFLDVATGAFVGADVAIESNKRESLGLEASAWPVRAPRQKIKGVVTPSGNLAFHGLPGLRRLENSEADNPWESPHQTRDFQIEVKDKMGRFLPCTFTVTAPAQGLAIFAEVGSPPWSEAGAVPLFSTPSRAVPGGLAVVRAELHDAPRYRAAWALMEASYSSAGSRHTSYGLADDQGRVLLMFAYPEPGGQRRPFDASPPGSPRGLSQQQWTLDFRFFYKPNFNPDESPPSALIPKPEPAADYGSRLTQPEVSASRDGSPPTAIGHESLQFGRELNLGIIDLA